MKDPVEFLKSLFEAGLAAVDPAKVVPPHLPAPPAGRTVVVGAGKGVAAMAKAVEDKWPADKPLSGLVVTQYGYSVSTSRIEVLEGTHPFPDDSSETACRRILDLIAGLGPDDLVLFLFSGGGSSLLSLPADNITRADKKAVTSALMNAGAPIQDINCVRKHLSAIKGGRLGLAAGAAQVLTLILSDVPGDTPHVVASGPSLPDPTTQGDALAVLEKYKVIIPDSVRAHLSDSAHETPKPGDAHFARHRTIIVARGRDALFAAAQICANAAIEPIILGDNVEGEAREVGAHHAAEALRFLKKSPCIFLSGGETTVTVKGAGRGGRNTEYLIGAALGARGQMQIYGLACGTDGLDGNGDNAGAFFTPDTLVQAKHREMDPFVFLEDNDSYAFFDMLGGLIKTGPTRTSVNDFRAILVL